MINHNIKKDQVWVSTRNGHRVVVVEFSEGGSGVQVRDLQSNKLRWLSITQKGGIFGYRCAAPS